MASGTSIAIVVYTYLARVGGRLAFDPHCPAHWHLAHGYRPMPGQPAVVPVRTRGGPCTCFPDYWTGLPPLAR